MSQRASGGSNPPFRSAPPPRLSAGQTVDHSRGSEGGYTAEEKRPKDYYEVLCTFSETLDAGPKWSRKSTVSVPFIDHEKRTLGEVWLHCTVYREWDAFRQSQFVECSTTDSRDGGNPVNVSQLTAWMYGFWDDGNYTTQETIQNGNYVRTDRKTQNDFPFPHDVTQACGRGWSRGPTIEGDEVCDG